MTKGRTEPDGNRPRLRPGAFPAMALVLAFVCVVGASKAVNQALRHTNLDMLLSAIRDGFVPWMLASYGLIGLAAGLVVWALGRHRRRHLKDLGLGLERKPAEPAPAIGAAPPGGDAETSGGQQVHDPDPRASGGTP